VGGDVDFTRCMADFGSGGGDQLDGVCAAGFAGGFAGTGAAFEDVCAVGARSVAAPTGKAFGCAASAESSFRAVTGFMAGPEPDGRTALGIGVDVSSESELGGIESLDEEEDWPRRSGAAAAGEEMRRGELLEGPGMAGRCAGGGNCGGGGAGRRVRPDGWGAGPEVSAAFCPAVTFCSKNRARSRTLDIAVIPPKG
jgi:hypothetical protein